MALGIKDIEALKASTIFKGANWGQFHLPGSQWPTFRFTLEYFFTCLYDAIVLFLVLFAHSFACIL